MLKAETERYDGLEVRHADGIGVVAQDARASSASCNSELRGSLRAGAFVVVG
jgi:hypothetical protein